MKIQPLAELIGEMRAVARGEIAALPDAGLPSADSAEAVIRLLTRENRELLRIIRDQRPVSVAALARLSGRAEPNLLRTLGKLEAFGLIEMRAIGRRRMPVTRVSAVTIEIDPCAMTDRIVVAIT
jgi:predicted transcriptional regulator